MPSLRAAQLVHGPADAVTEALPKAKIEESIAPAPPSKKKTFGSARRTKLIAQVTTASG